MSEPIELADRLHALREAIRVADGTIDADTLDSARSVVDRADGRLRHGTHHTVVALAGPTGSGKSSLFNALAGEQVSDTGVRRPTTSDTHALVWGGDGGDLLDWMQVKRRHHASDRPEATNGRDFDGLVLLDLPDFDSTQQEHRLEVDRMVELVDLFVWVVDPQKYADQSLHEGYLQPLAGHASVMRFVLSKADTLTPEQVTACVDDFASRLADDGIADAVVHPVSTLQPADPLDPESAGGGIDGLRDLLADEVGQHRAVVARVEADLAGAAGSMRSNGATVGDGLSRSDRKSLAAGLARAAGVDAAAAVVAERHRREARIATGWPVTKWVNRLRKNPLKELPLARQSSVASAEVGVALRDAGDAASEGLEPAWATGVRRTAMSQHDAVLQRLGRVTVGVARTHGDRPMWWGLVRSLQWLALGVAAVGAIWLVLLFFVDGVLRIDIEAVTPKVDFMPLPTLLLLGGLMAGVIFALLARLPASIGARRRAGRVQDELRAQAETVADELVVAPIDEALATRRQLDDLLEVVAR